MGAGPIAVKNLSLGSCLGEVLPQPPTAASASDPGLPDGGCRGALNPHGPPGPGIFFGSIEDATDTIISRMDLSSERRPS